MSLNMDKELLKSFVDEAKSYVQKIKSSLETLNQNSTRISNLEEIYRLLHIIKGASSMIGVTELRDVAENLEKMIKDLTSGNNVLNNKVFSLFINATNQINDTLDKLLEDSEESNYKSDKEHNSYEKLSMDQKALGNFDQAVNNYQKNNFEDLKDSTSLGNRDNAIKGSAGDFNKISDELFDIFRLEVDKHLEIMKSQIEKFRKNQEDLLPLQDISRGARTINVAAGMVGLTIVSDLTNYIVQSLDNIFDSNILPDSGLIDLIEDTCEIISELISCGDPDILNDQVENARARYREISV